MFFFLLAFYRSCFAAAVVLCLPGCSCRRSWSLQRSPQLGPARLHYFIMRVLLLSLLLCLLACMICSCCRPRRKNIFSLLYNSRKLQAENFSEKSLKNLLTYPKLHVNIRPSQRDSKPQGPTSPASCQYKIHTPSYKEGRPQNEKDCQNVQ